MKRRHWSWRLKALGACPEGLKWARTYRSFEAAWYGCERRGWLVWLLMQLDMRRHTEREEHAFERWSRRVDRLRREEEHASPRYYRDACDAVARELDREICDVLREGIPFERVNAALRRAT